MRFIANREDQTMQDDQTPLAFKVLFAFFTLGLFTTIAAYAFTH
ncbi:hypothetical protein [Sandarakinorhabdus sp.]